MKNKITFGIMALFIIGLTLCMSVVEARGTYITQEQLSSYSETQIKNYLINNFEFSKIKDNYIDKITFYFRTNSIRQTGDRYTLYTFNSKAYLDRNIWNNCLSQYTFNQCKTALITNYGINEQTGQKTIYQQARESLISEYKKILYYKSLTQINTDLGGVSIE